MVHGRALSVPSNLSRPANRTIERVAFERIALSEYLPRIFRRTLSILGRWTSYGSDRTLETTCLHATVHRVASCRSWHARHRGNFGKRKQTINEDKVEERSRVLGKRFALPIHASFNNTSVLSHARDTASCTLRKREGASSSGHATEQSTVTDYRMPTLMKPAFVSLLNAPCRQVSF